MTTDEFTQHIRQEAIREVVPYLEMSKPYKANDSLACKLYEFVITYLASTKVTDVNDKIMAIEDAMSFFDHDLSDYLMLGQYQVDHEVEENGTDPIVDIRILCDKKTIAVFHMSLSTAVLMYRKRQRELG